MNLYGLDYSLFDVGFNDPSVIESLSSSRQMMFDRRQREREEEDLIKLSTSILRNIKRDVSPPKRRHDGTSPLPLGMDWSPAPSNWDGPNTIWPHDFRTGWSYCATIPSWSIFSKSGGGSEPIVFYRVQVGLQSPEGVTTTQVVLRRFSDFLKLSSDLKGSFHGKKLPLAPSKGLLRSKSRKVLEERRCTLEDWLGNILVDMDFSRSAQVACFLELEAAARSAFSESSHHEPNVNLSCNSGSSSFSSHSDGDSAFGPNYGKSSTCEASEFGKGNSMSGSDLAHPTETTTNEALCKNSNATLAKDLGELVLPKDEQQKMNKLPNTVQRKLVTSKTDMEDLTERSNHEVHDLETEQESTKKNGKENLEHGILIESERFTQMQWDMEELRRKCKEMEAEKDQNIDTEATKTSIIQENETLRKELDLAREQLKNVQKCHEEANMKSKSNVKLLAKEVKSLRSSQSELRLELDKVAKERTEFEMRLVEETSKREHITAANAKLLHECEILRSQLEECSVNYLVDEENKLKLDAPSPLDALNILATSENRIALLLAEVETCATNASNDSENVMSDDGLRKMVTNVLIDNANLRKQANSIIRCALGTIDTSASSGTVKGDDLS